MGRMCLWARLIPGIGQNQQQVEDRTGAHTGRVLGGLPPSSWIKTGFLKSITFTTKLLKCKV